MCGRRERDGRALACCKSGSLGRFLRLSSELGQEAGDEPGGAREE